MVNRYRGRIRYYALWNEQDGTYWNPDANAAEYGRLLGAFGRNDHAQHGWLFDATNNEKTPHCYHLVTLKSACPVAAFYGN